MHSIELRERILLPEDGLILGNGDLSVSVYQDADRVVFRFGKGDVWDRRLDLSDDPRPAHIDEIARGIRDEKWKCGPYGGPVDALNGTDNPVRMRELCQGSPPSYRNRPYPCPKPVGELAVHLPPDQMGMKIEQRLDIEEGTLEIVCTWPSGVRITLSCGVPPRPNVLVVHWKVENWTEATRTGSESLPPVWFSLYRWADPSVLEYSSRFLGRNRTRMKFFRRYMDDRDHYSPLDPPAPIKDDGHWMIEQTFHPDPTFPEGFRYLIMPLGQGLETEPVDMPATGEARLHVVPGEGSCEGWLGAAVLTTGDPDGAMAESRRLRESLAAGPADCMRAWFESARQDAREFWARSRVSISDGLLENLWYETLHIRRCAYRADATPPGLFLPSTLEDYSHWHGDYHTNYNFQEPFWGDYTANHVELGDAFFKAMEYMIRIGRKIARDYYDCRGVFIQLTGYPIVASDDPIGTVPMGRLAYMTGWVVSHYWWRYRYTLDKDWLRDAGYPVIRDCALFYTDFLKRREDGLFHAFPSNQGEDGFSGDPKDYTDRAQIIRHARFALRVAIQTSELLDTDNDLRPMWREILKNLAPEDGDEEQHRETYRTESDHRLPPEFIANDGRRRTQPTAPDAPSPFANRRSGHWLWYFGQLPWRWMIALRNREFVAERDLPFLREHIVRWRHPNGLLWGMSVADYGHAGAWTESLGVIAPLQDMMLQSWDEVIHVFPAWPKDLDARFESFRAEGAFLVSASWAGGAVESLEILSERGSQCCLREPWVGESRVLDEDGEEVALIREDNGILRFSTEPGERYAVAKR